MRVLLGVSREKAPRMPSKRRSRGKWERDSPKRAIRGLSGRFGASLGNLGPLGSAVLEVGAAGVG